jgi:molybdopterin-guanine dinucleotide biosynthesis protein A
MSETSGLLMLPAGLVLAGGASRRMGGTDKALMPLGGRPLLAHALDSLRPQASPVAVSANGDLDRLSVFGAPVLPDRDEARMRGPLSGILSGLIWADREAGATHLLTVAVDTPFFAGDLGTRLAAAAGAKADRVAVARSGGRWHPVFALWPVAAADRLARFLREEEEVSVMRFLLGGDVVPVDFALRDDGGDPFFNINTPQDLASAEAMQRARRP